MEDNNNDWISKWTGGYNWNKNSNSTHNNDNDTNNNSNTPNGSNYWNRNNNDSSFVIRQLYKEQEKRKKILIAVVSIIILCGLFASIWVSCTLNNVTDKVKVELVGSPYATKKHNTLGHYAIVTGSLKNVTDDSLIYVSITYACYDATGNHLGTTMANTNYLAPGTTWNFETTSLFYSDVPVETVKFVEIIAY